MTKKLRKLRKLSRGFAHLLALQKSAMILSVHAPLRRCFALARIVVSRRAPHPQDDLADQLR